MAQAREKFATQVDAKVLRKIRKLAEQEGRQLQVLVEEALTDPHRQACWREAPRLRYGNVSLQHRTLRSPVQKTG
jgi:hypothetical protein